MPDTIHATAHDTIDDKGSSPRRVRHRSRRRKIAESITLILGVPLLLALVLGLSVELIEYRPIEDPIEVGPLSTRPVGHAPGAQGRRMPAAVAEIQPLEFDVE